MWEAGKDRGKKAITLDPRAASSRARGKVLWDIAEVSVPSGGQVRYWLEAKDNDNIGGPNIGRSRELHLKVTSPRERHEETLGRHQEVAEKIVRNLGGRLTLPPDEPGGAVRESAGQRAACEVIVEPRARWPAPTRRTRTPRTRCARRSPRCASGSTGSRRSGQARAQGQRALKGAYTAVDAKLIAELEDDAWCSPTGSTASGSRA